MNENEASERCVALKLAYDGSSFHGWQIQPNQPTVQGVLQTALARIHGVPDRRVVLHGSGRTDAGVHALAQVAHYRQPTKRPTESIRRALRSMLPGSIVLLDIAEVSPDFHARRSALCKTYRYRIINRTLALPFETRWAWHIRDPLNVHAMRDALPYLRGRHDFAGFTNSRAEAETTVRDLMHLDILARKGRSLEIEARADGFLYKMVRNIVGWLVEIGRRRRRCEETQEVLASAVRGAAGVSAPPQGLCLVEVRYAVDPFQRGAKIVNQK